MSDCRLILIAAPELIPALRQRVGDHEDIITFSDAEPLRALEAIVAERPAVVALERLFAASPRGAALIARIKADAALDGAEIRVLSHDTDYQRISPRRRAARRPKGPDAPPPDRADTVPLDRGTRRAPRFRIQDDVTVLLDDQPARLVDLSVVGAQVVSVAVLRPGQRTLVVLDRTVSGLAVEATIIWARLELSKAGPAYRGGVDFVSPDRDAIGAFCRLHRKS